LREKHFPLMCYKDTVQKTLIITIAIIIIVIISLKLIYDKTMDRNTFIDICMHSGEIGIYFY